MPRISEKIFVEFRRQYSLNMYKKVELYHSIVKVILELNIHALKKQIFMLYNQETKQTNYFILIDNEFVLLYYDFQFKLSF